MSAIPTPRTDEELERSMHEGSYRISPCFARTLERELAMMTERERCAQLAFHFETQSALLFANEMRAMREELAVEREKVRVLREALSYIEAFSVGWKEEEALKALARTEGGG